MKTETGVMIMKNGKAWGVTYEDGQCTSYGWVDPDYAPIHNPLYCKNPSNILHHSSPYLKELSDAKLVPVERRTETIILN